MAGREYSETTNREKPEGGKAPSDKKSFRTYPAKGKHKGETFRTYGKKGE